MNEIKNRIQRRYRENEKEDKEIQKELRLYYEKYEEPGYRLRYQANFPNISDRKPDFIGDDVTIRLFEKVGLIKNLKNGSLSWPGYFELQAAADVYDKRIRLFTDGADSIIARPMLLMVFHPFQDNGIANKKEYWNFRLNHFNLTTLVSTATFKDQYITVVDIKADFVINIDENKYILMLNTIHSEILYSVQLLNLNCWIEGQSDQWSPVPKRRTIQQCKNDFKKIGEIERVQVTTFGRQHLFEAFNILARTHLSEAIQYNDEI